MKPEIGSGADFFSSLLREIILTTEKYAKSDWLCRCLEEKEEESHITSGSCKVYGDLTSQFGDLKEDSNLVEFFIAVLDRRDSLEDEDRKQQSVNAVVDAKSRPRNRTRLSRPRDLHPTGPLQH